MVNRSTIVLLALTIAVAVVVSGCGGGSDSNTASGAEAVKPIATSSLSKAQFVAKANARCAARKTRIRREIRDYARSFARSHPGNIRSMDAFPGGVRTVAIPGIQDQIAEVRQLGAPAGEEAKVEAILVALEEGIEAAKKQPLTSTTQFVRGFGRATALARKYGLNTCVYG